MRPAFIVCLTSLWILHSALVFAQEIRVAYVISEGQRSSFEQQFKRFTDETGITVTGIAKTDAGYRQSLPDWLLGNQDVPDIVYMAGSQRVFSYAAKKAFHPITQLWTQQNFDNVFTNVKGVVTYKGSIIGLPVHYYNWGLYYKKSIVDKYGGPPANWEQFIALCEKIQRAGITPIGLGNRDLWPAAGWFDYLDLRLNGMDFHMALLAGTVSFTDPRAQKVLQELKRMIDLKLFNPDTEKLDWDEVFPYIYRDQIAFTLSGNYASSKLPPAMISQIGYMRFPKLTALPDYEDAPVNILVIPAKSNHIADAEMFIRFMARADIQADLAKSLGYLPANRDSNLSSGVFVKEGADMLRNAAGLAEYFDRDTNPAFGSAALAIFADFIKTGDIADTTRRLEWSRKAYFKH